MLILDFSFEELIILLKEYFDIVFRIFDLPIAFLRKDILIIYASSVGGIISEKDNIKIINYSPTITTPSKNDSYL